MELKLIVLAGAKQGLEIPLKKDKFLIGRAKECALRAGSEAISRRHCALERGKGQWTVRDLGSRNGTFVNDQRISEAVVLSAGDELRVGPLKFRVAAAAVAQPAPVADDVSGAAPENKPRKQPPVRNVADVAKRSAGKAIDEAATEDDVSRWLLGVADQERDEVLKETRTIRLEETTLSRTTRLPEPSSREDKPAVGSESESESDDVTDVETRTDEAENSGRWNLFRLSKSGAAKKKPGKLPARPDAPTKDSGEAAADLLREMTRRR